MAFKKHRILFMVAMVALLTLLPAAIVSAQPSDIGGHWAEPQIAEWFNKGLIKGNADGTFRPNDGVTRAEFVTMTNNAFGFKESGSTTFSDVSSTSWFANEVSIATKAGYIKGYGDGTFKPMSKISREEVSVIMARLLDLDINAANADSYVDAAKIQNWSKGSVGAVGKAGLMSGYQDKTFRPQNSITRAEALVTLDRAMKYDPDVEPKDPAEEVAVTGVKLDRTSVSVKEGNTVRLKATVEPEKATNKKVEWSSSDKNVATVDDNGLVKGIKRGTATVTVTTDDGDKTATCKVEVTLSGGGGGGGGGGGTPAKKVSVNLTDTASGIGKVAAVSVAGYADATQYKLVKDGVGDLTGMVNIGQSEVVLYLSKGDTVKVELYKADGTLLTTVPATVGAGAVTPPPTGEVTVELSDTASGIGKLATVKVTGYKGAAQYRLVKEDIGELTGKVDLSKNEVVMFLKSGDTVKVELYKADGTLMTTATTTAV